ATPWQLAVYPNPYATDLTAELTTTEAGVVALTLLDATGRVVLQRQQTVGSPRLIFLDEAGHLSPGIYTLLARQNAHLSTVRLVHQ
ncbi:MAG: T9SS type A sorting domain-containing protein, partial [Hymenobacter sp.]